MSGIEKREPLTPAAAPPAQPKNLMPIVVEKEAAWFMDGKSCQGTSGPLERWRTSAGPAAMATFVKETRSGDRVFVSQWSVKRVSQSEYKYNLYLGERVEFAKAIGPKGYWAAGMTPLSNFPARVESESRRRRRGG